MYCRHKLGKFAENAACNYLEKQGLKLIEQNYRCNLGEIDLIMRDGDVLVFVEVRARIDERLGDILESITQSKRSKIIRTATFYLQENNLWNKEICRFDVVAAIPSENDIKIEWIRQAFDT